MSSIKEFATSLSAKPSLPAGRFPNLLDVEQAIRTLIVWVGDDPDREGLADTPARVARAYQEWLGGYAICPEQLLQTTFENAGYEELVVLKDIPFRSMCEHHLARIEGTADIAYLPRDRVVGISKLARVVDAYARRLQIQERLTGEIADTLQRTLNPRGVAVVIRATHDCIASRGIHKHGVSMVTRKETGELARDEWRQRVRHEMG